MTAYKNAKNVLPQHLLHAVQDYAAGEMLYIPIRGPARRWGERTGARMQTDRRNAEITARHKSGIGVEELAAAYHLSVETVQKIVKGSRGKRL